MSTDGDNSRVFFIAQSFVAKTFFIDHTGFSVFQHIGGKEHVEENAGPPESKTEPSIAYK
jgi:hypothetical protein